MRSYLAASKGFIMLFTLPFGPTYFTPEKQDIVKPVLSNQIKQDITFGFSVWWLLYAA